MHPGEFIKSRFSSEERIKLSTRGGSLEMFDHKNIKFNCDVSRERGFSSSAVVVVSRFDTSRTLCTWCHQCLMTQKRLLRNSFKINSTAGKTHEEEHRASDCRAFIFSLQISFLRLAFRFAFGNILSRRVSIYAQHGDTTNILCLLRSICIEISSEREPFWVYVDALTRLHLWGIKLEEFMRQWTLNTRMELWMKVLHVLQVIWKL